MAKMSGHREPRKCCIQRKSAIDLLKEIIELDDTGQLHRDPLDTDHVFINIRKLLNHES